MNLEGEEILFEGHLKVTNEAILTNQPVQEAPKQLRKLSSRPQHYVQDVTFRPVVQSTKPLQPKPFSSEQVVGGSEGVRFQQVVPSITPQKPGMENTPQLMMQGSQLQHIKGPTFRRSASIFASRPNVPGRKKQLLVSRSGSRFIF